MRTHRIALASAVLVGVLGIPPAGLAQESPALHVHLVWAPYDISQNDLCHSGETYRQSRTADEEGLIACVLDSAEQGVSTEEVADVHLEWEIVPEDGESPVSRFTSSPPSESASDGRASAQIQLVSTGFDEIFVRLCDDASACSHDENLSQAFVSILSCCEPDPPCAFNRTNCDGLTIRYRRGAFRGDIGSNVDDCMTNRRIGLWKVRKGHDRYLGADRAHWSGSWSIRRERRPGRYYAVAKARTLPDGGICERHVSRILRLE